MLLRTQAKLAFERVLQPQDPPSDGEILLAADANPDKRAWRVERKAILSGDDLVDARSVTNSQNGLVFIDIRLTSSGGVRFARFTTENIGREVAMVLDRLVVSAPVICTEVARGELEISGGFTPEAAQGLALMLRIGTLPAKVTIVSDDVFPKPGRGK